MTFLRSTFIDLGWTWKSIDTPILILAMFIECLGFVLNIVPPVMITSRTVIAIKIQQTCVDHLSTRWFFDSACLLETGNPSLRAVPSCKKENSLAVGSRGSWMQTFSCTTLPCPFLPDPPNKNIRRRWSCCRGQTSGKSGSWNVTI